jgi:hypothetical protein
VKVRFISFIFLAGLVVVMGLALPLQARQSEVTILTITANRLNVREFPYVNSQVVASVRAGERFAALDQTDDGLWWQINTNGVSGWISDNFVQVRTTVYVPVTATPPVIEPSCLPDIEFFFENNDITICATGAPIQTQAAFQRFQGGFMVWLGHTRDIFAFSSLGVQRFPESSYEAFPDMVETAPQGLYPPIRGFGRVWNNFETAREGLSWALSPEVPYTATVQSAVSHVTGNRLTYVSVPDGSVYVINLERNAWYSAQ